MTRALAAAVVLLLQVGCASRPYVPTQEPCVEDAAFAAARERAVLAGTRWMAAFLRPPERLRAVAADAPSIFLELGERATSAAVRTESLPVARELTSRLLAWYLAHPHLDREALFHAISLLGDARALGVRARPLVDRVRSTLATLPTSALYGAPLADLSRLSESALYSVMIDVYTLERASAAYPDLSPRISLRELLGYIVHRPFVAGSQNDLYLATHVFYVLSDYGRLRPHPDQAPAVYRYLRAEFDPLLRAGDVDLVAELVEVFRMMGFEADRDRMVCQGTRFLLEAQRADGSFGDWQSERDAYDAIHPAWTAVHALRDRRAPTGYHHAP
jgi:hypothetical protein